LLMSDTFFLCIVGIDALMFLIIGLTAIFRH
jgi:hypothetical protein